MIDAWLKGVRMRIVLLLSMVVIPLLVSCSPTELDWSEEVKLHDGKIIVIKRHEELGFTGFPVYSRGLRQYYQFCYAPMRIHWKSKPGYFPETFDIVNGKAYAKVSMGGCDQCMVHGYPETDALYFTWDGGAWKTIDYKDYPKGLRYNMLNSGYDSDPKRDVHGLVTIAEKEARDGPIYQEMKGPPAVTGLNETLTRRKMCEKCRTQRGQTTSTSEVFLPAKRTDCD